MRTRFLIPWVATLVVACDASDLREFAPDPAGPPNIVLFMVDDLRHDSPGFAGHPFFRSPHMDRIADEGVVFEDAFVTTSLCSPSRASVLTGRYAHEHGVTNIWTDLPASASTFADLLRAQGYETAWIGKWHLNRRGQPHPAFDHWVSYPIHGSYIHPTLNVDGALEETTGHLTDQLTARALRYLALPRPEPFFLAVSHTAVHVPYQPQDRFDGLYAGAVVELPPTWDTGNAGKPYRLGCRESTMDDETLRDEIRDYYDLLAGVDESLGLILDQLETSGLLDNTLFAIVSDNGYMLGEHSMLSKSSAYESSMRIPMAIRFPAWFAPGTRVRGNLALNLDLPVTFLEAAGIMAPASMRGVSLHDLASGSVRRDEFLYQYTLSPESEQTPDIRALRTVDLKYVQYPGSFEPEELYDLRSDPDEAVNLAGVAVYSGLRDSLRSRLGDLRRELADPEAAASRAGDAWTARAFLDVRDARTGLPVDRAEVTISGNMAAGSPPRTGSNGRWYACAKTIDPAVDFRVLSVRAAGYADAGPLAAVQLRPGASETSAVVKLSRPPAPR